MNSPSTTSYSCIVIGHADFFDETLVSLRYADGAVLVVDAIEGVMMNTERCIQALAQQRMPFILVINKIDRLALELKLPPNDAFLKLRHTIDDVNRILQYVSG